MTMMEIILEQVDLKVLPDKLDAWRILTGYTCSVEVKGEFSDRHGLMRLQDFRPVEVRTIKRQHEYIEVHLDEGEGWTRIRPQQLIIEAVRLRSGFKLP
jgi:hypothetical protein